MDGETTRRCTSGRKIVADRGKEERKVWGSNGLLKNRDPVKQNKILLAMIEQLRKGRNGETPEVELYETEKENYTSELPMFG